MLASGQALTDDAVTGVMTRYATTPVTGAVS
jgi:hypothetical protein